MDDAQPITTPDATLRPRHPLTNTTPPTQPAYPHRLVVKFSDGVKARPTTENALRSAAGVPLDALLAQLALASDAAVTFRPLIDTDENVLRKIERRAAERSGRAQPDLAGMLIVEAPEADLHRIAHTLHTSNLVEFVTFQALDTPLPSQAALSPEAGGGADSVCSDVLPTTPHYAPFQQGYLRGTSGIDAWAAWDWPGGKGEGVTIADCEKAFRVNHEELNCNIVASELGITPMGVSSLDYEHGTSTLGMLVARDNGYGVTGIVPLAHALFFTEHSSWRRATAITNAIAAVDAGDVILLEMQAWNGSPTALRLVPAEFEEAIWVLTRLAVDSEIVVVAAAGNGPIENLDLPIYSTWLGWGDSGAIIVSAGRNHHDHEHVWPGNYGSRVDMQGWGQHVLSTGGGDLFKFGQTDNQNYTDDYNGTSSASAMVAGAVASTQGLAMALIGAPLLPDDLRQLLIDTGTPQGPATSSTKPIGPIPNLAKVVAAINTIACPPDFNGDGTLDTFDYLDFSTAFSASDPAADFDGDGMLTAADYTAFDAAFMAGCP